MPADGDALIALHAHLGALVVIEAKAAYLRTSGRLSRYQAFTNDADFGTDPFRLANLPTLGDAMISAGFDFIGEPGVWHRRPVGAFLIDCAQELLDDP